MFYLIAQSEPFSAAVTDTGGKPKGAGSIKEFRVVVANAFGCRVLISVVASMCPAKIDNFLKHYIRIAVNGQLFIRQFADGAYIVFTGKIK